MEEMSLREQDEQYNPCLKWDYIQKFCPLCDDPLDEDEYCYDCDKQTGHLTLIKKG